MQHVVVFSDVDGVLTGCHGPSATAAAAALRELADAPVSVVLCSTKTRGELQSVQRELGIWAPFVAERRAAAFVPEGYFPDSWFSRSGRDGYHVIEPGLQAVPIDPGITVSLLRQLYIRAFGRIHTVGLADGWAVPGHLAGMDTKLIVHDEDRIPGAVGIVDWACAIVEAAQAVFRRTARPSPLQTVRYGRFGPG
jgi:hypothetical protein